MRKIIFILLTLLLSVSSLFAQKDTKAKTILEAVTKKYASYHTIKTDFTYAVDNPQAGMNQSDKGTLYSRPKSNQYRIVTATQEMISDGKNQWTYLKEDKEVQLSSVSEGGSGLNPANLFTIYQKGYKYAYGGEVKQGAKTYHVIDLIPENSKQTYFKIRLHIDKQTNQIAKAIVFNKNGSKFTYAMNSFMGNPPVNGSTFTFDTKKYPGVEVVDLR